SVSAERQYQTLYSLLAIKDHVIRGGLSKGRSDAPFILDGSIDHLPERSMRNTLIRIKAVWLDLPYQQRSERPAAKQRINEEGDLPWRPYIGTLQIWHHICSVNRRS